jgi:hypothetical protein
MSHCGKYAGWMTDAALGALAPGRERELHSHVAVCQACREAYQHARKLAALVDQGVKSLVAREPSLQFANRLRVRIGEERAPERFPPLRWKFLTATAVAAAFAVALVYGTLRRPNPAPRAIRPAVDDASNQRLEIPQMPVRPERPATNQTRVRGGYQSAGNGEPKVARLVSRRRRAARLLSSPAEPEVLVPPGQFEAILQLAAQIRSGRIDGKQLIAADAKIKKPLKINSIKIAPLEPQESVPADPSEESPRSLQP